MCKLYVLCYTYNVNYINSNKIVTKNVNYIDVVYIFIYLAQFKAAFYKVHCNLISKKNIINDYFSQYVINTMLSMI